MQGGKLRHVVTIQQPSGSSDGYGNTLKGWADLYAGVPAEVSPISSRELWAGEKVETLATHKITIRYVAGINTTMRVVFGTRIFAITGVLNPDERNISLTLVSQEQYV